MKERRIRIDHFSPNQYLAASMHEIHLKIDDQ